MSASTSAVGLSVLDLSPPHEAVLPAFDTCEEDDDPDYLLDTAAAAEADSGMSTFRDQPTVDNSSGGSGGGGREGPGVFRLSHLSGMSGSSAGPSDPSASEVDFDEDGREIFATSAKRPNSLALKLQRRRRRPRPDDFNDDVTDEGGDCSDGAIDLMSNPDCATVENFDPESCSTTPSTPSPLGQPERMFRIVMAGDAAVGKTCFITRFCEGRFDSGAVSTLGVDFKTRTVKVDGHVIAVQLWDTAGQHSQVLLPAAADGVILVYDCTSERSFLSVRDWVESIRDSCGGGEDSGGSVPIMIVANKTDLREAARLKSGCAQRVIETEEGRHLAELFSAAIFIEASARSGNNVCSSVIGLCRLLQQREDLAVSRAAANAALELHASNGDS
uniref:Ras family protein n=1 Tax=Macrostomum lignano TaxID=282301 RepID=A0A1I8IKH3_9PLAT